MAVGGHDPSGGAGILADARAITAAGAWPCTVTAALTVQSTSGVRRVEGVKTKFVIEQLDEIAADMPVSALKTGALGLGPTARAVALWNADRGLPLVVDPVLYPSKGNANLFSARAVASMKALMARATLATPNIDEAEILLDAAIYDPAAAAAALREELGCHAVLLKGGHLDSDEPMISDWFATSRGVVAIMHRRYQLPPIHGTGCALASLIAGRLATTRGDLMTQVRWSIATLGSWMRRAEKLGRGMSVLVAAMLLLTLPLEAAAEDKPEDKPAPAVETCPASCIADRSSLDDIAVKVVAGLARVPEGVIIGTAALESDEVAPKGEALADKVLSLVAGRLRAVPAGRVSLEELRKRADKDAPGFIYLTPKIAGGRLHLTADAYPIARSVWARARALSVQPIKHAAAQTPIDADVRTYLTPLSFQRKPNVAKYKGADKDMLALACGDLDGDGANDLITMNRSRVMTVALVGDQVERLIEARWASLAPVAPAPMRQPLGFATIVDGRRYADVSITDRAGSVRLGPELKLVTRLEGTAVPHGLATACTWISNLLLGDKMLKCSAGEPDPAIGDVKYATDALASSRVGQTFVALRRKGTLVVRSEESSDRIIGRVGAQLALGDIDQDGEPEVVTSVDTLARKFDALTVSTIRKGKLDRRFRMAVRSGVEAVALCPPDGQGLAPIVIASKGEIWVVR